MCRYCYRYHKYIGDQNRVPDLRKLTLMYRNRHKKNSKQNDK